jgi:hypothetical protein
MLRNKRLTRQITVPVSAGLLANTDAYFEALGSYREGDPAPVVEQLSPASVLAVVGTPRLCRSPRCGSTDRTTGVRPADPPA